MNAENAARVWIGPSGWSYPDWNGTVYPARKPRGFKPLRFIARHFNAVEVNSSFYAIPTPRVTGSWTTLVPEAFRFAFKLTRTFTHEGVAHPDSADVAAFKAALAPVRESGRLGPVLIQFPWSFRYTDDAVDRLRRLADSFADHERVVEVRHASWAAPDALELLRQVGGYCNIDQPALRDCLGPSALVFGRTAYMRLHGRNADNWFAENIPGYERYNYMYSDAELREWVERLNTMCSTADDVYAFANNHYRGQGVANALELRALLTESRVLVPETLARTHPRLAQVALPPRQPDLFGPAPQ